MKIINQTDGKNFTLYHGDCVEVAKSLPDNSIHYSVYSPPFASLYTYSASDRDMGNCKDDEEFYHHYRFLIKELYRIMIPGRLVSFHCMNLPTSKARDGFIGIKDFRGDLIRLYQEAGFIFHSEVCIWKDPVTAMQRTKAIGLLHKQIKKDSCLSRQGIPDYLVTMRKPGENPEPVEGPFTQYHGETGTGPSGIDDQSTKQARDRFSIEVWQRYASPVWMDINPSDTLQYRSARDHEDERHICLASGSLVLTKEMGYIPIESVKEGDMVLSHTGNWRKIIAKRCNGINRVVKVKAQGVADLRLTPTHKLWTRKASQSWAERKSAMMNDPEWIEAKDTKGSYINLKLPPVEDSALTKDEWWIIGRWLGDGHKGGHKRSGKRNGKGQFLISCSHDESHDLISKLGDHAGHVAKVTATQIAIVNLRREVRDVLSRCGENAKTKRVPAEAFCINKELAESFLSGYLSADGHHVEKYDRTCASSVSRALLLGMAMISQRARGVVASVYAGRTDRKGEIEGRIVNMSQDWVMSFRESEGYRKSGWIGEDGAWEKVREIKESGEEEVWDIQVEEDESFTAEGAIVHNCPLQLQVISRALDLWSNPGDIVFSPFMGIGSEGYVSLEMGRKFIGAELKESYFKQASINLENKEIEENSMLF